jgi:phosphoribulokinase
MHKVLSTNLRRPYVIAISGEGGSGKSTFAYNLQRYWTANNSLVIELDDYLFSRKKRKEMEIETGYDPRANKLDIAASNISDLIYGRSTLKPVYDHHTGEEVEPEIIYPAEIIIIEGVTALYDELVPLGDISFYINAPPELQLQSRLNRDVNERGYSYEDALRLFHDASIHGDCYVRPSMKHASVILGVRDDYHLHVSSINDKYKMLFE